MDKLTDAIIIVNLLPSNYNLRIDEENAIDKVVRAAVAFNAESLRPAPENKPLTLEQLRQMDEKPVWIVEVKNSKQDSRKQWQQFAYEEPKYNLMAFWEFGDEVENTYDVADYGKTWLAYARKPEQEG